MRKYTILFILFLNLMASEWSQAQTIAMRVPDSTMVAGNSIDIPIYCDNSLTGLNVMSYILQMTFNQSYFQAISVNVAGTLSAPFGNPTVNYSVPGMVTMAGYGISPLSGKGKFLIIRFKALKTGTLSLGFSGVNYNYFNEGTPVMSFKNGTISITAPPAITVSPDNKIITNGEQQQFSASGGTSPFQWFVTNQAVANITASGMLTGMHPGFTKVVVQDSNGLRDTTNLIEIRAMRLSIPTNLSHLQGTDIDVPVNTTDLSGLNIYSGNFNISFNQDILTPVGIVQTGTLLADYPEPEINLSISGNFSMVFYGTTPLSGNGTLVFVRFHVSSQNTGTSQLTFTNGFFNEDLLPTFTNGTFTAINLPILSLSPNSGNLVAGETLQFTVNGGGIAPFTWSASNTDVASVSQTGQLTAKKSGVVKVTVNDSNGATASSGNFQLYDTRITMPDTVTCPDSQTFYYPIRIKSLPTGESILAMQGTVTYNATYLTLLDIETTGTLTDGWTYTRNPSAGQLLFVGYGPTSFNAAGTILKLKFSLNPSFTNGTNAYVNLNNVTLNEGFPLPLVDTNGSMTGSNTPNSAGTISGTKIVCQGQNSMSYSVPTITGATSYLWTLPNGATETSSTNSISVNYGESAVSGNISVKGHNSCGDGLISTLAITVNPLPENAGILSGTATVNPGQNSVSYSVPAITNATSYIWTLPTGATGTSATSSITVNYGAIAASGNITVKGHNSCGDGIASTLAITVEKINKVPVANAGLDQSVNEGTLVTLDGSGSTDGDSDPLTYLWTAPAGITLSSVTAAKPTFTAPEVTADTDYTLSLVVNDGKANSPADQVKITVKQVNKVPVANAGSDQSINEGLVVTLDGLGSTDGDGDILTYVWIAPAGITLSSVTAARPIFTAPEVTADTDYSFSLVVNDGKANSTADAVKITVKHVNKIPVANAGPDQSINEGVLVTLDGSGSNDGDGDALTYLWTVPEGITLSSATAVKPTFTVPEVTTDTDYSFSLVVNDGEANSIADVVKITVKNVVISQHFTPVWSGNGVDHMNINIYSAKLDGVELEAGDEIGIFDGNLCVGVGTLTGTLSQAKTLDMIVSRNDGSGNGYDAGNTISFKLYDASKTLEMFNVTAIYSNTDPSWSTDGKFTIGATAFAELSGLTKVNQDITLNTGWNIISAYVVPSNLDLKAIFQSMIDAGTLKKVMDEAGKTIENFGAFGGWKNNIGNLNSAKGYKVNVLSNSTLSLEGTPVSLPLDIALATGWNIISYPSATAQDAKALVQSLIDAGKLKKVMDEAGKTIENFGAFGGWKNNIGNLLPGKGYKVNVLENCILIIPAEGTKSAVVVPELLASEYFKPVFSGNGTDHASINLVNLQASGLQAGDEIGVFDGKLCVGSAMVGSDQLIAGSISIPASANDGLGESPNGFVVGNRVNVKLYRDGQNYPLTLAKLEGQDIFDKNASLFAQVSMIGATGIKGFDNQISFRCYPNPFSEQITIEIQSVSSEKLDVNIYDMDGKLVRKLSRDEMKNRGILVWDGRNESGIRVVSGTYLINANGKIKKVVLKE